MIKVAYHHTQAPNGGFGILGKQIAKGLSSTHFFKLVYLNGQKITDDMPDIIFTYGMPDLYKTALEIRKLYKKKIPIVHYFVWESSELPKDFVREYKKPDLLITATKYTARQAKKQGLKSKVWHHSVDNRFKYTPRKDDGVFTFLHHNAYEFRKGWELVLQAFVEEFREEEPVKLIMKARERKQSAWLLPKEKRASYEEVKWRREHREEYLKKASLEIPNIEEIIGHISDEEMVRINDEADCFVFPAKGEGWALPPFEAMAQGIVPIIPNKGCFTEWFDKDTMIEVKTNGYIDTSPRYPGYMFSISLRDLKKKMRWAYEHQEKLKDMGKQGSIKIHKEYNLIKIMKELHQIIYESRLVK